MTNQADRLYEHLLVLRCQTGDEAAFEELVGLYSQRLRYYLRKMLGDAHSADDVLQDIWLDVFRSVPRLTDAGAFSAWIYRIARDRICRELRRRRPAPHRLVEEGLTDESEEAEELSAKDAERVHAALDELAPVHREVLVLRFLERMSYEDIAQVVGCQLGTVRSRIHYGKRALRRALERTCNRE